MSWSTPDDLRGQVQRLWDRGELLRACVSASLAWPLRLKLTRPTATDLTDRFEAVREWVRVVVATPHVHLEWQEWTHRVQGRQRVPAGTLVETLDEALAFIGKAGAAARFRALWEETAAVQPALLPWLSRRPLEALELLARWPQLLAVVAWLQTRPRPGVYLRQVDVPGVDTKFIELHRRVLTEWLDLVLPPAAIDATASGAAQFNRRYGFLDKPVRIRFRVLDRTLPSLPGCRGQPDIALDAASFADLALPVTRVFITENETNFLALPAVAGAIALFGAGYGWGALARATWLHRCQLHYWGDIDTHGFTILDQLRAHFSHVASFLMTRDVLSCHRMHWGDEPEPARDVLTRLTVDEAALYDDIRCNRIQPQLRLEQERVAYRWVVEALAGITQTD